MVFSLDMEKSSPSRSKRRPTPVFIGENTPLLVGPVCYELGEEEVQNFRRKSFVTPKQLERAEEDGIEKQFRYSMHFFLMGWGTFACAEAILLQTSLFDHCLLWGDGFYAIAAGALFIPGVLVQVFQGLYDLKFDKALGTLNANTFRVVFGHVTQLIMAALLIWSTYQLPAVRGSNLFLFLVLGLMGISLSVLYGGYSQVVAIFPRQFYSYFFMGTMTCFLGLAPLNTATGDLCTLPVSPPEAHAVVVTGAGIDYQEESVDLLLLLGTPHWGRVFIYYGFAMVMNLVGLVNFLIMTRRSPAAAVYFENKDNELRQEYEEIKKKRRKSRLSLSVVRPKGRESVDETSGKSFKFIFSTCKVQCAIQFVSVLNSLIVAAEYTALRPSRPDIFGSELTTLMLYDYYVMMFLGISLTLSSKIRSWFSERTQLYISLFRSLFVLHFVMMVRGYLGPHNDFVIIFVYSLFMMAGGFLFSVSFADATAKFEDSPSRSKAANLMNLVYYSAISISVVVALVLQGK